MYWPAWLNGQGTWQIGQQEGGVTIAGTESSSAKSRPSMGHYDTYDLEDVKFSLCKTVSESCSPISYLLQGV